MLGAYDPYREVKKMSLASLLKCMTDVYGIKYNLSTH